MVLQGKLEEYAFLCGGMLGNAHTGCWRRFDQLKNGCWKPFGKSTNSVGDLVGKAYRVVEIFWEMY
jgi:hypothetical protein